MSSFCVGPPPGAPSPDPDDVPNRFEARSLDELLYEKALALLNSKNEKVAYSVWHDMMQARGLLKPPSEVHNSLNITAETRDALAEAFRVIGDRQDS